MYHSQNAERRLTMTFQMSQALAILQMAHYELQQFLQEEIDKNPLLEDVKKSTPQLECDVESRITVSEHLSIQIREVFPDLEERKMAEKIGEYIDERGFLTVPLIEIPVDQTRIENILCILQTLDPPGIFARNLQESLLIQLQAKGFGKDPIYKMIQNDYEDFLYHRYALLKKKYPEADLSEAIHKLASLQLRPLEGLKEEFSCPIIPDLFIRKKENLWIIGMCDDSIPRFQIQYDDLNLASKDEQKTIDHWRSSGKWLLKALQKRREIILQIAHRVARKQGNYLLQKGNLVPFTIQDLATDLGLHESTISRALSEKYVETPRGVILLRSLLTATPQKKEAKEILQELIAHETVPLTDDQLAVALKEKGFEVARRTISKYRKELKIPVTKLRALK